jgi:hypothetical protein
LFTQINLSIKQKARQGRRVSRKNRDTGVAAPSPRRRWQRAFAGNGRAEGLHIDGIVTTQARRDEGVAAPVFAQWMRDGPAQCIRD